MCIILLQPIVGSKFISTAHRWKKKPHATNIEAFQTSHRSHQPCTLRDSLFPLSTCPSPSPCESPSWALAQTSHTDSSFAVHHSLNGANTTTELWPPNPNELEIAAVIWCWLFTLGTVSMSATSSTRSSCKQWHATQKIASTYPGNRASVI